MVDSNMLDYLRSMRVRRSRALRWAIPVFVVLTAGGCKGKSASTNTVASAAGPFRDALRARSLRAPTTDLPTPWRSEQLRDGHAERVSETVKRADRQVQVTRFYLLKVSLDETELFRKLGLGEAVLGPQLRNSSTQVSQEP